MGKLIGKILAFLLGIGAAVVLIIMLSTTGESMDRWIANLTCSSEYDASEEEGKIVEVEKIQQSSTYKKLIVDDSVCASMFKRLQDKNDKYLFAGTNRAFAFPGYYVQIKEFIKNNKDAEEVYIFVGKDTWETTLDAQYGYHCLILPLIYTGTYDYLDEETKAYCEENYGPLLLNKEFVNSYMKSALVRKLTLNLLIDYHGKVLGRDVNVPFVKTDDRVSPLSKEYFYKIVDLCNESGIALHLIHDPTEYNGERIAAYQRERDMIRAIENDKSRQLLEDYLDSILYYPAEDFIDDVHFKGDDSLNDSVIRDMQRKTGLLEDIVL